MSDRSFANSSRPLAGARSAGALVLAAGLSMLGHSNALAQATGSDTVPRYRCTLIDGSVHLLIEDPRARHPDLAQDCAPVRVAIAPLRPGAPDDRPPWVGFSARFIESPDGAGTRPGPVDVARAMPLEMARMVRAASDRHQLDPALVSALIYVESRYRPDARSPKGAMGLMQLMPATAARYGVRASADLLDPRVNVDVGVRHLRSLRDRYDGRIDLMLAAYNAGEGAVERYGQRVPPYPETEDYVRRITALVSVPENAFTP